MNSKRAISQFFILLTLVLGVFFFLHITLLKNFGFPAFSDKIVTSYIVNGVIAAAIFAGLFIYRYKLKNYIGFLFMAGSFIKFIFFFILFYPAYKADGDIDKLEFAAFFSPYVICLVIETFFTAKMLQKLD